MDLELQKTFLALLLSTAEDLIAYLEVDVTPSVGHGPHSDHAASTRLLETVQQQARQQEVAQVVHSKLHSEAVLRPTVGHQTCTV